MKVQFSMPQLARSLPPQQPGPPEEPPQKPQGGGLDHVGAVQLGSLISDVGMGAAYTFGPSTPVSGMGLAMAAFHGARGAAFAASAFQSKGMKLQQRIGVATAESMLAGGHVLGALGQGAWSLPLLVGGATLNAVADYRYRTYYGVDSPTQGKINPLLLATSLADGAVGVGCALQALPAGLGYAAGLAHLGAVAGYYGGSVLHPEMKHHWHSKGFGHALLAAGQLAGAAGAGLWALPVLAGGTLITNLQDYRQKS